MRTGRLSLMERATAPKSTSEDTPTTDQFAEAIREAEDWAAAATEARRRLEALDAATVAISQELSLERVLQIIVDSVRPLVGARYAALGIPDDHGSMERFITSGMSEPARAGIGTPPRGKGLLGVSLHDSETLRVDDIATDPRSAGFPPGHPSMSRLRSVAG